MPDDADADVVEVVVGEGGGIPLLLAQRMALVAAGAGVEELPAALGGVVDGRGVARDEAIERRVERQLRAFVGGDGAQQIAGVGWSAEDLSEGVLVFRDRKSTRLNSSHLVISYAVFCLKKKKKLRTPPQRRPWHT